MIWQNYELGNTVLESDEFMKVLSTERSIVEIGKNTLAVPIKLDDGEGYVIHGQGKLLLDTIIETEKGAIGKPIEKEIGEPFLMIGDTEEIRQHLSAAKKEDIAKRGYANEQEFLATARKLCDRFFRRARMLHIGCVHENRGSIFAFSNNTGKLDILVAIGSKLVYKAIDRVFVSNKDKVVLKTHDQVILARNRKSFTAKSRCC
jgi:hypothetical protein